MLSRLLLLLLLVGACSSPDEPTAPPSKVPRVPEVESKEPRGAPCTTVAPAAVTVENTTTTKLKLCDVVARAIATSGDVAPLAGHRLDVVLYALDKDVSNGTDILRCKLRVEVWRGAKQIADLNIGGNLVLDPAQLATIQNDCIAAVTNDLIENKILPLVQQPPSP